MNAQTRREYLSLGEGRQLHYRIAGKGPPLVMLHPSPQSSAALLPAIASFSDEFTCIALDTPGYGQSDDWLPATPTMRDYSDVVMAAADTLGIDRFFLYGAATGAQIGIEVGKYHADRIGLLLLDSNGHIDPDERHRMMESYFPSVAPKGDGSHLQTYWEMCSGLFRAFPWNSTRSQDQLGLPPMPAEAVQALLLRYLDAGETYAKAYRAAFEKEDIAHLEGMIAPTVMTRWEGSVVLGIADALIAKGLPRNVSVLQAGPTLGERYAVQLDALREAQAKQGLPNFRANDSGHSASEYRCYVPYENGVLHARRSDAGTGARRVLLHAAGHSSLTWGEIDTACSTDRPWIALDLPGHGFSGGASDISMDVIVRQVKHALHSLDESDLSVAGHGLGDMIASQLADQTALVAGAPTLLAPDLIPRPDGGHLSAAWDFAASDPRLAATADPEILHRRTADLLRAGNHAAHFLALESRIR